MMKYLVEIIPESITDHAAAAASLAATLKIDTAKAAALLKRNPVTKPVSQTEAEKVARLFTKAGIEVFVRAAEEVTDSRVGAPPIPVSEVTQSIQPSIVEPTSKVEPSQSVIAAATPDFKATDPGQRNLQPEMNAESTATPESTANLEPTENLESTAPSVVPEMSSSQMPSPQTHSPHVHDPFQTKSVQGEESHKIPSGFFTPVPEGAVTSHSAASSPNLPAPPEIVTDKPKGGLGKIAFASIVPGLLALVGLGAALYLLGLPFLRAEQRTSAKTAAVSLASSVGGWIGDVSLDNPALSQQVQNVLARTQGELRERGVELVMLTDQEGNVLAGWHKDGQSVPATLLSAEAIQTQISNAVGGVVAETTGTPLGESDPNTRLTLDNEVLGLASAAVRQGNTPVGSVVVGVSEQSLMTRLQPLLPTLALAAFLPLLLGILLSLLVGRNRD